MNPRPTLQQFSACIDQVFDIVGPIDTTAGLRLTSVDALSAAPDSPPAFSLLFLGPPQPLLPQHTYTLQNAQLGQLAIFLVPLGPADDGIRYEAVFN